MVQLKSKEDAVKQAIDGGYRPSDAWIDVDDRTFLEPEFWKALGKARGWDVYDPEDEGHDCDALGCSSVEHTVVERSKIYAHQWFENRIVGGNEQKYWESSP